MILLDQYLPSTNGDAVLQQLRSDPETSTIPLVVISADAILRQLDRLLDEGAAAFLARPIDANALIATVDRLLAEVREPCPASKLPMRAS